MDPPGCPLPESTPRLRACRTYLAAQHDVKPRDDLAYILRRCDPQCSRKITNTNKGVPVKVY